MNAPMNPAMMEALRLTQAGRLAEATALIQSALGGTPFHAPAADRPAQGAEVPLGDDVFLLDAEPAVTDHRPQPEANFQRPHAAGASMHARRPWPRVDADALRTQWRGFHGPLSEPAVAVDPLPDGARFITESYTNAAGTRSYKLYVPSGYDGQPLPLVVMLHGCTQNPDDFAAGTRMNELAEKQPCLIVYPAQPPCANPSKCWNWFKPGDQQRDGGEPSIIAGITRHVRDTYAVDPQRIYVAGLSAGGAMAVTMAISHPELYAAVGIHSGLPHAVAGDLPSALAAMQQGGAGPGGRRSGTRAAAQPVAAIVFHGDRDTTVHPGNGDQVIAQCAGAAAATGGRDPQLTVEKGQVANGHAYTRTIYHQPKGAAVAEHWLIHGAGHAWSGGSARGSYTDPKGPDATQQMMRFFLEHPHATVSA